jgi:hypothetical protein
MRLPQLHEGTVNAVIVSAIAEQSVAGGGAR